MAHLLHLDIDRTRRRRDHRPPLEGRHHDYRLAQTISAPARNINEIVHGKSLISPRRGAATVSGPRHIRPGSGWTSTSRYNLDAAVEKHGDEFDRIVPLVST